jgi:hypothetical protein
VRREGEFLLVFQIPCTTSTDFVEALISVLLDRLIEVNIRAPSQLFYVAMSYDGIFSI